jgi:protein ImuB
MRRVISLFLPLWPSDRLRRQGKDAPPRDKPLVTARMEGQRRVLASVDRAAMRCGLSCGVTVTHAQSLVPDLTVVEAKPEEDEAALDRLGLWCVMYSPLVTPDPPDGVFIDVAGSAHLFHGEIALMEDLCKRLKRGSAAGRRFPIPRDAAGRSRATGTTCMSHPAAPRKPLPACRSLRCGLRPGPSPRSMKSGLSALPI